MADSKCEKKYTSKQEKEKEREKVGEDGKVMSFI